MFDTLLRARELLRACGVSAPPVDLGKLARRQGIRKILVEDLVLSGELRRLTNGGFIVRLNAKDSEARRRFTLAHEIGHTLLMTDGDGVDIQCGDQTTEDLCNLAASELLIPDMLLRRIPWQIEIDSALSLARQFKCSLEAAAWKMLNTDDSRGALLLWSVQGKAGEATVRLVAMPRTLTLTIPFRRGIVLSTSDANWAALTASGSDRVSLRNGQLQYWAERKQLGKKTIATLIKIPQSDVPAARGQKRIQGSLFL